MSSKKLRRNFTVEFKTAIVKDLMSGKKTGMALAKEHKIHAPLIYKWKKELEPTLEKAATKPSSADKKAHAFSETRKATIDRERIKELAIKLIESL